VAAPSPSPHVIADRYLTSPAALAARPFGPVDALDTRSGRGAQVRIVFAGPEWEEAALADAVARWCGIGCSEVCGVLDFGRHGGRWFLVLPPSLGLPVERWRTLRRPTAADATRLTLAFGRLVERVAGAGFSPDAAGLADVTVGPGPTPFLERPLLRAGALDAPVAPGDGQRVLAAVCSAALGPQAAAGDVDAWSARAAAGGFSDLTACLDELERCAAALPGADAGDGSAPAGLDGLFDECFDLDGPPPERLRDRRLARLAGIPVVTIAVLGALVVFGSGAHAGRTARGTSAATGAPAAVVTTPVAPAASAPARAKRAPKRDRRGAAPSRGHAIRHRTPARVRAPASPPAPAATTAAANPAPSRAGGGSSPGGTVTLPAPGGTTLPAP
jgi:hypothetical protein